RFSTAALTLIRGLKDPVEQEHYLQVVARTTGVSMTALQAKLSGVTVERPQLKLPKTAKVSPQPAQDETEERIIGLALRHPELRRWVAALPTAAMATPLLQQLLEALRQPAQPGISYKQLLQNNEQYVKIVQLKIDNWYANWEESDLDKEMARLVKKAVTKHREQHLQHLVARLRDAEAAGDEASAAPLRRQINALIKEKT
ncbi:MAG: hypothetical protein Q4B05_03940, partial [Candidatus Saccharibacteria bacterium]|nr:hypothetical protein [Candidatus Saccharibacteria bacterium]